MIAPESRQKTLKHLQNALKPLSPENLGEAAAWVTFPTQNPHDQGGLSPEGKKVFQNDAEILKASAAHKEQTRVELHAVIATCGAFVKANHKQTTALEKAKAKEILALGITIFPESGADRIQTSRKNGEILTNRFKGMMAHAVTPLKTGCPKLANVIFAAATIQKQKDATEMKTQEGIAQMA